MKEAFGISVPQTLEDVCDPSRLALLVYDMQIGIVSQLKGCEPVTARVAQVLEAARHAGVLLGRSGRQPHRRCCFWLLISRS